MTSVSVIVASCGRPSLRATLASVSPQLRPGDELLVDVNDDAPWGHEARNRLMPRARGDFLMFLDDDDVWVEGAREVIEWRLSADKSRMQSLHMFRMQYSNGQTLWIQPVVACGNVSTQMFAVPNDWVGQDSWGLARLPRWGARYEGDWDFIEAADNEFGTVWHPEVITLYNHGRT